VISKLHFQNQYCSDWPNRNYCGFCCKAI